MGDSDRPARGRRGHRRGGGCGGGGQPWQRGPAAGAIAAHSVWFRPDLRVCWIGCDSRRIDGYGGNRGAGAHRVHALQTAAGGGDASDPHRPHRQAPRRYHRARALLRGCAPATMSACRPVGPAPLADPASGLLSRVLNCALGYRVGLRNHRAIRLPAAQTLGSIPVTGRADAGSSPNGRRTDYGTA
jgi:hypothetical protein